MMFIKNFERIVYITTKCVLKPDQPTLCLHFWVGGGTINIGYPLWGDDTNFGTIFWGHLGPFFLKLVFQYVYILLSEAPSFLCLFRVPASSLKDKVVKDKIIKGKVIKDNTKKG